MKSICHSVDYHPFSMTTDRGTIINENFSIHVFSDAASCMSFLKENIRCQNQVRTVKPILSVMHTDKVEQNYIT